jgi:hypothetical protein
MKRKTPAQRLKVAKAAATEKSRRYKEVPAVKTIAGTARLGDWSNTAERAEHAHAALTLWTKDAALVRAFREFELDPQNPYDWATLANAMAETLYGANRGRPKKWTKRQEREFVNDMTSLLDGARKQEVRAAEQLKSRQPDRFESMSPEEMRKLYYKLRPPHLVAK